IKIGEERVVSFFQHDRGVQARGDAPGKRRLADADRSFDGDVLKRHEMRRCYHRRMRAHGARLTARGRLSLSPKPLALSLLVFAAACASAPPNPVAVKPPVVTW